MGRAIKGDGLIHTEPTLRSLRPSTKEVAYEELCIQIIKRAALDYVAVIKELYYEKNRREILKLLSVKAEIERFFTGNWYLCLTEVDPGYLMQRIREMARKELLDEIKARYLSSEDLNIEKPRKRRVRNNIA